MNIQRDQGGARERCVAEEYRSYSPVCWGFDAVEVLIDLAEMRGLGPTTHDLGGAIKAAQKRAVGKSMEH